MFFIYSGLLIYFLIVPVLHGSRRNWYMIKPTVCIGKFMLLQNKSHMATAPIYIDNLVYTIKTHRVNNVRNIRRTIYINLQ